MFLPLPFCRQRPEGNGPADGGKGPTLHERGFVRLFHARRALHAISITGQALHPGAAHDRHPGPFRGVQAPGRDQRQRGLPGGDFFTDPDQLSALVILANYGRETNDNVIIPYAAGCQTLVIYPYREIAAEVPRAVVGLTDLSARNYIRQQLGDNLMTFAVPLKMFHEMEGNVEGSFLERPVWEKLAEGKAES